MTSIAAERATIFLMLFHVTVFPLAIASLACVVHRGVIVWRRVYISACSSGIALELPHFLSPPPLPDGSPHTGSIRQSTSSRSTADFSHQVQAGQIAAQQARRQQREASAVFSALASCAGDGFFDGSGARRIVIGEGTQEMTVRDCPACQPCSPR